MEAWARTGWRVWDLGNGTIMLQKLFNPKWQITSKSFLLSSFLIGFSFSPTAEISRLEIVFDRLLSLKKVCRGKPRQFSKRRLERVKWSSQEEKQIFLLCQTLSLALSTRDQGTRLSALFATRARARVVFTGSTFALLIFQRFRCFCNHFRHVFYIFKVT